MAPFLCASFIKNKTFLLLLFLQLLQMLLFVIVFI